MAYSICIELIIKHGKKHVGQDNVYINAVALYLLVSQHFGYKGYRYMYIQCIPFQWAYPVRTLTLGKQFVTFNYFRQRRQRFKFNLIDMWFSVLHPPTPKKSCFCKEGNPPFLYIQCNCALHSCAVIVLVCLLRFNVTVLPERNKTN